MAKTNKSRSAKVWPILLALYVAVLALSHLVARGRDAPRELAPGDRVFQARSVDAAVQDDQERVRVVYTDVDSGAARPSEDTQGSARSAGPDAPVLVLLHGSPGSHHDFDKIASALGPGYRLIAPDLPGFGKSDPWIPDYSIEAHADYTLQLLDELEVERFHLVAFSMGGGVALHIADREPERVRSLSMVAAIGVQELELFGSYSLNHAVHGLQLAGLQGLRWLVPHFGKLDRFPLGVPYARNFFDTDQRPLRAMLDRFRAPMLIVHGEDDFLVPPEVAREHERIVPQSELEMLATDHFLVWRDPEGVAERLARFVASVEHGAAVTRAAASEARVQAAAAPFDPKSVPPFEGPALLVAVLLLAAATLVSEDLTCISAGLLVGQGRLGFVAASLACFAGIFIGDLLLYLAGRYLGRPALGRRPLKWVVDKQRVVRAADWFAERGGRAILLSRFVPGLRLPTYVAAGMLRMPLGLFALYFSIAGLLWTPLIVGIAALVGERANEWIRSLDRLALPVLIGLALVLLTLQRLALPLFTYRGRRLALGSWRRKTQWEFWPAWLFYIPVAGYIGWLILRYRSFSVVTAVNPAIPTGGFVGESKSAILEGLAESETFVARHVLVKAESDPDTRLRQAREFLERHDLTLPVVTKPDKGQRGSGVKVVHSDAELETTVRDLRVDTIVQEYVSGPEFGVFYVRDPREDTGRLISVTEKRLPRLEGDGRHTIEELILRDERAICAAETYFAANAERLRDVPPAGSSVQLVELGTHCRGAVFLDGREYATPELTARIDAISHGFEGFYFGRYDLRVASTDSLRAGCDFKILELNGVTSEAAHIYDPNGSLRRPTPPCSTNGSAPSRSARSTARPERVRLRCSGCCARSFPTVSSSRFTHAETC